jgi:hypothetical protein
MLTAILVLLALVLVEVVVQGALSASRCVELLTAADKALTL